MTLPGQILFGKRRAYQRKVAVAEFAGVCSGDIYVLESKDTTFLLPELLPFLCQTEGFYQHAVGTSAGSLSPRTNWDQLAGYEFSLPPLDEQRRSVEILGAIEEVCNRTKQVAEASRICHRAFFDNYLSQGAQQKKFENRLPILRYGWTYLKISDLCSEIVDCLHRTPEYTDEGFPAIRTADLEPGILHLETAYRVSKEEYEIQISRLKPISGDIVFSREGERMGIAAQIPDNVEVCISQRMMHLRSKPDVPANLVMEYLNSSWVQRQISMCTSGSTSPHINVVDVKNFRIPVPPKKEWIEFSNRSADLLDSYVQGMERVKHCNNLRNAIRNQIFD